MLNLLCNFLSMKKTICLISILILIFSSCDLRKKPDKFEITGNREEDIGNLLFDNAVNAEVLDSFAISQKTLSILHRFDSACLSNKDWFAASIKVNKNGGELPYNPLLGITEAEYNLMLSELRVPKLIATGNEKLKFFNDGKQIEIESSGKLSFLNRCKIGLNGPIVLNGCVLDYKGVVSAKDSVNTLGSTWKAHKWNGNYKFRDSSRGYNGVNSPPNGKCTVKMGLLDKNGKRFINISLEQYRFEGKSVIKEFILLF